MKAFIFIFRAVTFGLLLFLLGINLLRGQEEPGAVWVMPNKIGLKFYPGGKIDTFSSMYYDSLRRLAEPMASIYFPKIKKYLYTEIYYSSKIISFSDTGHTIEAHMGFNIKDSEGKTIENGDLVFGNPTFTNGALFLPINDTACYLFTLGTLKNFKGLNTTFQHFSSNTYIKIYMYKIMYAEGRFKFLTKDVRISNKLAVESIAAVRHANGKDWWLVTRELSNSNGYLKFHVRNDTIISMPVQYIGPRCCPNYVPTITAEDVCPMGEICFNRSGTHLLVMANDSTTGVYHFDRCSGMLSNVAEQRILKSNTVGKVNYGGAISNSGNNVFIGGAYSEGSKALNLRERKVIDLKKSGNSDQFENHPLEDKIIFRARSEKKSFAIIHQPDRPDLNYEFDSSGLFTVEMPQVGLPNTANHLLPAIPYDFSVDRSPKSYRDTICVYDSTALGGWYPPDKHNYRWFPNTGLTSDTTVAVTFRPPTVNKSDTVYTLYMTATGKPGGCLEGQSQTDTFRVFVHGNGKGGCRPVTRPDAVPPQVFQLYPNPTDGTLYIKSSWEPMYRIVLYDLSGKLLYEHHTENTETVLNIGHLPDNVYLCKIYTAEGIFTQKVVLKK